jgi:hypothetical protein
LCERGGALEFGAGFFEAAELAQQISANARE